MTTFEAAAAYRTRRRQAYRAIFDSLKPETKRYLRVRMLVWVCSWLLPKDVAWGEVFRGALVNNVLADLGRFCRAAKSSYVPGDSHATAFAEGRREVWLRIMAQLHLDESDVWALKENMSDRSSEW